VITLPTQGIIFPYVTGIRTGKQQPIYLLPVFIN
jgi:hypothetical protein